MVSGTWRTRVRSYARSAFTMIELIFAIVLIAVVMLTIPTMIQVNNKALEGNAAQEAIFLVSSVLSEATTLLWDDNSVDANVNTVRLSKILDVNGTGNAAYDRWDQTNGVADINSTVRKGGLEQDLHRMFFSAETRPAQAAGTAVPLAESFDSTATGTQLGLKRQFAITATRVYVDDTPDVPFVFSIAASAVQTNIKMTQVEINATIDGTPTVISRLRAYTCNIGETDYAKRRF